MVSREDIIKWLQATAQVLEENKEHLTDLDSAIGDADHGINMERGFKKVFSQLPPPPEINIDEILKKTGFALITSVGGASGPLYGTFFMEASRAVKDRTELAGSDLVALFEAGIKGIMRIGKAQLGDKTMLDALIPALEALRLQVEEDADTVGALSAMTEAAKDGMKKTIPLLAKKGRASYLGERSIGHQDPGATSTYLVIRTLLETVKAKS